MKAIRVACYARKSTDDDSKAEDAKSVVRQVEHCRQFAEKHGWVIAPEDCFVDDGISGARFDRPGLLRLLNALRDIDIVITSELSRIGREQTQNAQVLAQFASRGVRLFFYLTGEELKYDDAVSKFLVSAVSFAAELEREKASQRARDGLLRRAQRGWNTGGGCFGYRNVAHYTTSPRGERVRSHTDFEIDRDEAKTVVGIFKMYLAGHGTQSIAKAMNGDPQCAAWLERYFGGTLPKSPRHGTGSWAPSSIRTILRNERYIGRLSFGKHRNKMMGSRKVRERQEEFLVTERAELRVIEPKLWEAVQRRLRAVNATYVRDCDGRVWGRPEQGRDSKYLLSGLVRCACGSSMVAHPSNSGSPPNRRRHLLYVCGWSHTRGLTVCANRVRPDMAELDEAVLGELERMLTPEAVEYMAKGFVEKARKRLKEDPALPEKLAAELAREKVTLDRFMTLVRDGSGSKAVAAEIAATEARITDLEKRLAEVRAPVTLAEFDAKKLRAAFMERLPRFRELLREDVPRARQALRKLLVGPIRFQAVGAKGYELSGETRLGTLFESSNKTLALPRGLEPLFSP